MNIFKGKEELEEMNKSDILNMMKDEVYPFRVKGGITITAETETVRRKGWRNEWYDYELTSTFSKESKGTDMSQYRPTIDGTEYTWGALKAYPETLLRVLAYRLWQQNNGSEEE